MDKRFNAWVKDSCKPQDRAMDFNEAKYKKFINITSDSSSQYFKKLPLVKFKEEYPQLSKRLLKCSSLLQLHMYVRSDFFVCFNQNSVSQQSTCEDRHEDSAFHH